MKIAIYSRKSVYTGKGESIENQIEMCRQYISARIPGAQDAVLCVYEDEGFSGKTLERPQLKKMLEDARKERFDYVVCYRLDRISRSVSDFAPLVEEFISRDIGFICIKEQFDTSSPMGKAMMYIASVFAQLERETIAERVRDNMMMLARTGRWLGGAPPTGFLSEKIEEVVIGGKIKSSCRLKWNPAEIEIARTIYEKFLEVHSISGVAKHLVRTGIKNRHGTDFSMPGIKEILQNPVYCIADKDARDYFLEEQSDVCFPEEVCSAKYGLLSYNKRDYTKKHSPRHAKAQWVIAVGRHRGIVTGKNWVHIQHLLARSQRSAKNPPPHNDYSLFSGILLCKQCGGRMFAKARSTNRELFDYICSGKLKGGAQQCPCANLNGLHTDERLFDIVLAHAKCDANVLRLLDTLKKKIATETGGDGTAADAAIARCERELAGLAASLSQPGLSEALLRRASARAEALEQELIRHHAEKQRQQTQQESSCILLPRLWDAKTTFTTTEKREFIRLLVRKIEWDGSALQLFLYGE